MVQVDSQKYRKMFQKKFKSNLYKNLVKICYISLPFYLQHKFDQKQKHCMNIVTQIPPPYVMCMYVVIHKWRCHDIIHYYN